MTLIWAVTATLLCALCTGLMLRACASRDEAWKHAAFWQQQAGDHLDRLRKAGLL